MGIRKQFPSSRYGGVGGAAFLSPSSITHALPPPLAIIRVQGTENYSGSSNTLTYTYTVNDTAPFTLDNVSVGPYDNKTWFLLPLGEEDPSVLNQVETNTRISGSWDTTTAGTFNYSTLLTLFTNGDVRSTATVNFIIVVNHPPPVISMDGNTTNFSTTWNGVQDDVVPFTFTNTSTGFYDHAVWTSTNISLPSTGNAVTGTITLLFPTQPSFTVTLTLYDVTNQPLATVTRTTSFSVLRHLQITDSWENIFSNTGYTGTNTAIPSGALTYTTPYSAHFLTKHSSTNNHQVYFYTYYNTSVAPTAEIHYNSIPFAYTVQTTWSNGISTQFTANGGTTGQAMSATAVRLGNSGWSINRITFINVAAGQTITNVRVKTSIPIGCGRINVNGVSVFDPVNSTHPLTTFKLGTISSPDENELFLTAQGQEITLKVNGTKRIGRLHIMCKGTIEILSGTTWTKYQMNNVTSTDVVEFAIPDNGVVFDGTYSSVRVRYSFNASGPTPGRIYGLAYMNDPLL